MLIHTTEWRATAHRLGVALCAAGTIACSSGITPTEGGDAGAADAFVDAVDAPAEATAADATAAEDSTLSALTDGAVGSGQYPSSVDLGVIGCGQAGTQTVTLSNGGPGPLAVSASTTGIGFSVTPSALSVPPGGSGILTVGASVPVSATAGTPLTGALLLFTDDANPANRSVSIPLSATPSGATLAFASGSPTSAAFPSTEVGEPASPIALSFVNVGNAPATVSFAAPSSAEFSLSGAGTDGGGAVMAASATLSVEADFTPSSAGSPSATASVTVAGITCGTSVSQIPLSGSIGHGVLSGWPTAPIDFGPVPCGGTAPLYGVVTLSNSGNVDATVTSATITGAPGFSSTAEGLVIPAGGGASFAVQAPAVPALASTDPLSATLTVTTDADSSAHTITLSEEPEGAILAFDTSATPDFGSFGQAVLLQAVTQAFRVTNTGSAPATVTLSTGGTASPAASTASPAPFTVVDPSFALAAGGTQADSVVFSPTGPTNTASITMTATGNLCAPLPSPLPLTGAGIGGGPTISTDGLEFGGICGGAAPAAQTFIFGNQGNANLTWSIGPVTGPGRAYFTVSATPSPGVLEPGKTSTVTVNAAALPSPAATVDLAQYGAQFVITTDVPYDPPHTVALVEYPLGDQLSLSVPSLRFGQFPIDQSTIAQNFTLTNDAFPGSPAANVSLSLTGSGSSAYSLSPSTISGLGPSGGVSPAESVVFSPTSSVAYPATVSLVTSDSLCTALPGGVQLIGTGTQGVVSVSATTIAFGTDASDPSGLVDCGATGLAHTFTVSNTGNQAFNITGLSLGMGASSPYALSGDAATALPLALPIGGSTTITVTPSAIPAAVANPSDPTPFTDTLTLTTDAALDSPHRITLVMQARGAVIADTPLATSWAFGTVTAGTIGTFSTTITNTGNAPASIALQGLSDPAVFGLQGAPVTVAPDGVTQVVGQFSPSAVNETWTDQGTLVVTSSEAFCEPLPSVWSAPKIALSGSSISGSLPVTVVGSLAFPSTACGSAAPPAQTITLTNTTSSPYPFTAALSSGAFYTLQNPAQGDGGSGVIAGNGVVVLGVTPQTVTPGPGAVPGSAPYADNLVVAIQSPQPSGVTIPVSWTVDGAVLSLPEGLGPNKDAQGNAFYPADSQSGFTLPIANAGTGSASVSFGLQPAGAFSFSPAPPVSVLPGITALPRLMSAATDATCPATTPGSVTFLYSGPVCRPIPVSQVTIQSCVGTF
jgi:hypothetical protein